MKALYICYNYTHRPAEDNVFFICIGPDNVLTVDHVFGSRCCLQPLQPPGNPNKI